MVSAQWTDLAQAGKWKSGNNKLTLSGYVAVL
jgi:hypothetical protein